MSESKRIFSGDAPQFFGCPEWFTADQVSEMRRSFEAQKITTEEFLETMGPKATKCLSFDYDPENWLNCAQWSVRAYSVRDDYVILDFIGTAG